MRRAGRLLGAVLAGATAVACTTGTGGVQQVAAWPSAPSEFAATFEVDSLIALVAGAGQAWALTSEDDRASLARIDHTGRSTDVVRLSGQHFGMAPHGHGVVVTRRACAAEECEETAVEALVVDAAGETVAEVEIAREWGGLDTSGEGPGDELLGVQGDVVWMRVAGELVGHDLSTGRTTTAEPVAPGALTCLLADGLHALVVVDEDYFNATIVIPAEGPGPAFDVEVQRLVDGTWTPVPESSRTLTHDEIYWQSCTGGGLAAGGGSEPAPAWSAASGWVERGPYRRYPDAATAPEPTARGSAGQLFVLVGAGVVRRWFAGPDGPMSSEVLEVPADVFVQLYEPQVWLTFDASDTVAAGCIQRHGERELQRHRCWLGSR